MLITNIPEEVAVVIFVFCLLVVFNFCSCRVDHSKQVFDTSTTFVSGFAYPCSEYVPIFNLAGVLCGMMAGFKTSGLLNRFIAIYSADIYQ